MDSMQRPRTLPAQKSVLHCTNTTQKLESAIFNALSLGQWEIAQAHFAALSRGDSATRENAREMLKLLIMEASNFWSVSIF